MEGVSVVDINFRTPKLPDKTGSWETLETNLTVRLNSSL
jgi:hypothetical protein